jgi:hypothetical protein
LAGAVAELSAQKAAQGSAAKCAHGLLFAVLAVRASRCKKSDQSRGGDSLELHGNTPSQDKVTDPERLISARPNTMPATIPSLGRKIFGQGNRRPEVEARLNMLYQ